MRRKLNNAKDFLNKSTEQKFFTKYSGFIDEVYAEFRSPGDIEYISEFGRFLEELWEKSKATNKSNKDKTTKRPQRKGRYSTG